MPSASICATCGTKFPDAKSIPVICPICLDDRQFVPTSGQEWISPAALEEKSSIRIQPLPTAVDTNSSQRDPHSQGKQGISLYQLEVAPSFAIGNRAILVKSISGNILWDCIAMLDKPTIEFVKQQGGLKAIAISHPHFYSNMKEWATTFDCPIYIHQLNAAWVIDKNLQINYWQGDELPLFDDIRIVHTGGHFPGSSVLAIPGLSESGTLLCGDSLYVSRSKKHTAVMYSYPNQILLSREDFIAFEKRMSAIEFDSLIGAFNFQQLLGNGRSIYESSMQRYKAAYQL